jgi:primosomal protein N' (replication factor Y)
MAAQQNLFDTTPEPWEVDDEALARVATVLVRGQPVGELDYLIPDSLGDRVEPGRRVQVPLGKGNRLVEAYCVRVDVRAVTRRLKSVEAVLDTQRLLSPAMLRLTHWIAQHYLCDWTNVLEAVVPAGVRVKAGTREQTLLSLAPDALSQIGKAKLSAKQVDVLRALAASDGPMTPPELVRAARCTTASVQSLRKRGLLLAERSRVHVPLAGEPLAPRQANLKLNDDQRAALDVILESLNARRHETILVHGVTGSGKTEVYIQAIDEVVRFGRQAIVLVPEISLTPQTVERFRARFGQVAVLHSHLSDVERHWHWQQIVEGQVSVVVGARSAIFAPTPHLGLIVLDEEHEASFKQEIAPRYHARDVALARAEAEGVPLVLGSATPSLESWQRAQNGAYRLVSMPRRVENRPMPRVGVVDLRMEKPLHAYGGGAISRPLHNAITAALADDGQVILLLNRRGFSTHIQCPACGHAMRCPNCEIALTHHRTNQRALCHYCDYEVPAPPVCPQCSFGGIRYSGLGTQKLEAEVRARFKDASCLRMDTDTMQAHGAHEKALAAFRSGEVKILLGTQMIAKGLDFPNVTLVGVINADTALHLPDFRAAERTFQLVTQVSGRTGRGPKGGRVIVQTFSPDHPAIHAAAGHDYAAFAAGELPMREMLRYPPYASMIRLVIRGPVARQALGFAEELGKRLAAALEADSRVLGPAPAPFSRLRGMYRYQIHLHGPDGEKLRQAVRQASVNLVTPNDVQWIADVDPVEML